MKIILFLFLILTSCGLERFVEAGRRPPVMCEIEPCVMDYNPILREYDIALEEAYSDCESSEGPVPLTADMYEPHHPSNDNFVLSQGDVLEINIFDEKDSYVDAVTIAPDGRLYYDLLDGIPAAGLKVPELADALEEALKEYYVDPIISLSPKTAVDQNFKILGRVRKPGVYSTVDPLRLREAIALAGGLQQEDYNSTTQESPLESIADLEHSFIIRDNQRLDVDFHDLLYNPSTQQDIFVCPGDYIYIAPRPFEQVYVLGNVHAPMRVRYTKGMRLMDALANSGGWTMGFPYSADVSKVVVIRGCLECPLAVMVDVSEIYNGRARDVVLQAGDIIYVTNKTMRFGRVLVEVAINSFLQAFSTTAAGYYAQFNWFHISPGGKSHKGKSHD